MSNRTTRKQRLAVVVTVSALMMSVPTAAFASDQTGTDTGTDRPAPTDRATDERPDRDATIARIKERAAAAIERRVATLERLTGAVTGNPHVTEPHETALLRDYGDAVAGLGELGTEIAAATTLEELREMLPKIAADYRVYLVIVPKSREVVASDTIPAVADRFSEIADRLETATARAAEAGFDVGAAEEWLATARDEISEAARIAGPVAGQVINLGAQHWPDPAQQKLEASKEDLQQAHASLRAAREALHEARAALRTAVGRDAPAAA